jgi:hypothetical protein
MYLSFLQSGRELKKRHKFIWRATRQRKSNLVDKKSESLTWSRKVWKHPDQNTKKDSGSEQAMIHSATFMRMKSRETFILRHKISMSQNISVLPLSLHPVSK